MKLSNIPFKLESGAYRFLYRARGTKPSSAPYLSGDTFRFLCSRFYEADTTEAFDPSTVKSGELIFCDTWLLKSFLEGPAPIVLRSTLTDHFYSLGLPLLVVDSYGDERLADRGFLEAIYAELAPRFENRALWFDYWKKTIGEKR